MKQFAIGDRIRVVNPGNRLHGYMGTVVESDSYRSSSGTLRSVTVELELPSGELWRTTYEVGQLNEIDLITQLGELVKDMRWFVYVLVSEKTGRTYVGVTVNLERRLRQHNGELSGGAKATRGFRPWRLARTIGPFEQRAALKEERRVKKLRKRRLTG
ncbi:MAG TPA: GIY-YIG nuclease family protein [Thermoleophilia bacterium]|nr:GIY-YIG nuclease family protein [Thermoleophilia bacterium]